MTAAAESLTNGTPFLLKSQTEWTFRTALWSKTQSVKHACGDPEFGYMTLHKVQVDRRTNYINNRDLSPPALGLRKIRAIAIFISRWSRTVIIKQRPNV